MFASPSQPRLASKLAALLAVPFLIGSLAACGTSNESTSKSDDASEQSFEDWQLKFASCMRDEGIDFPDPGEDSAVSVDAGNAEAFEAASNVCMDKVGTPPGGIQELSPEEEAKMQEQALESAKCLRDRGYDVPDPKPGEGFGVSAELTEEDIEACLPDSSAGGAAPSISRQ